MDASKWRYIKKDELIKKGDLFVFIPPFDNDSISSIESNRVALVPDGHIGKRPLAFVTDTVLREKDKNFLKIP